MMIFAFILGLPARHWLLLPVVLLSLPVAVLFGLLGCIIYPLNVVAAFAHRDRVGTYASVTTAGIQLRNETNTVPKLIAWDEVTSVRRVKYPMAVQYELEWRNNGTIQFDFVDYDQFEKQVTAHDVPFSET